MESYRNYGLCFSLDLDYLIFSDKNQIFRLLTASQAFYLTHINIDVISYKNSRLEKMAQEKAR